MTTIGIVYRTNDLFTAYVPTIVALLKKEGCAVVEKVFLQGQEVGEDELESWYAENPTATIICDSTCFLTKARPRMLSERIHYPKSYFGPASFDDRPISLDGLVSDAILNAYVGYGWENRDREDSLEKTRALFQKMAKAISEKIGAPSVVVITKENITDHLPLSECSDEGKASDAVSQWIREIFSDCEVRVVDGWYEPNRTKATWHLIDRHCFNDRDGKWEAVYLPAQEADQTFLQLQLPIETALTSLPKTGLVTPILEQVTPYIFATLQKGLAPKA